ncbi:hypothetical protein A9F13_01g06204 [Clavispora lusitaniae]|uniref:Uncharacterized protein n=1 Tax=Clavispora lusitaniae TaxID=36911 RepID=A0AA91Q4L4_CLALS|nr:hypothetical protein A9F13_01g06204 [Clavispora lusitaniae]
MDTPSFLAVGVPSLVLVLILLMLSVFYTPTVPEHPYSHYIRLIVFVQVVILCYQLLWTVTRVLVRSGRYQKLPESCPSGFVDKFLKPIVGEMSRFSVITLASTLGGPNFSIDIYSVYVVAFVYSANFCAAYLMTFSPLHYKQRYERFLHQHSIYTSSKPGPKLPQPSYTALKDTDLYSLAAEVEPKPTFNLDSFRPLHKLSHSKSMPVLVQNSQQAHLNMIDRLYSVSPKNTLHLQIESDTKWMPSIDNLHAMDQHSEEPSIIEYTQPENFEAHFNCHEFHSDGASFTSSSSSDAETLKSRSPVSTVRSALKWFNWLLPLPSSFQNQQFQPSPHEVKRFINKKLSSFTLNSETATLKSHGLRSSYGAIDLENQSYSINDTSDNVHEFYKFAAFSNKYFDASSSHSTDSNASIDPSFLRFGVLLSKLSVFQFVLYGITNGLRHFAYTLILSSLFLNPSFAGSSPCLVVLMMIAKLFSNNYLHQQSTLSHRITTAIDFFITLALFIIVYCSLFG